MRLIRVIANSFGDGHVTAGDSDDADVSWQFAWAVFFSGNPGKGELTTESPRLAGAWLTLLAGTGAGAFHLKRSPRYSCRLTGSLTRKSFVPSCTTLPSNIK